MDNRDEEIAEKILLGAKIATADNDFKILFTLGPYYGLKYIEFSEREKMQELEPKERALRTMALIGKSQFVAKCNELTRLSGIIGDDRKRYSSVGLDDVLRKLEQALPPTTNP